MAQRTGLTEAAFMIEPPISVGRLFLSSQRSGGHSSWYRVARNLEGVPQALGDPVNGDLDGKAIHCSRLVKGPFRPTNSCSISFWSWLSFCALGPLWGRDVGFRR